MRPELQALDFQRSPFIVIWELTRACALACVHCRAEAMPRRDPRELSTSEGLGLIEAVRSFGSPAPLLVFTGGDPLRRPDVFDLVAAGTERGLRVALTPSGTAAARREKIVRLKDAGLARLAVSLDGSEATIHDAFRRVRGSYDWTMRILEDAREAGLPIQINTTVTRYNRADLPAMTGLLTRLGIVLWSVFFLIPTGRGRPEDGVSAQDYEAILNDLYDLSWQVPFGIKTTEAPHYRRIVQERARGLRWDGRRSAERRTQPGNRSAQGAGRREYGFQVDTIGRASAGVNDGNGFVFVDHTGDITPSGFLPLRAGNVRTDSLVEVYRQHPLFQELRDPERLRGRCGQCQYRTVCGGSRSRAYAMTGDHLGEDPCCLYEPAVGLKAEGHPLAGVGGGARP
ncbi:MAG TPA: TIGR04053 family radical SAM/SPASM domain-containing protein [Candidatus Methylomirabilis sp.]|nr:TIGR04053 family radical SAM/SPASM domain-containing protein [Candidatus Methylomirabilis sp.]